MHYVIFLPRTVEEMKARKCVDRIKTSFNLHRTNKIRLHTQAKLLALPLSADNGFTSTLIAPLFVATMQSL